MKTLFFGTPELAVPFLSFLTENSDVVGVVTRADKPADRGHALQAPPVKVFALSKNLPVFQPVRWDDQLLSQLSVLKADLAVVVAYGKIIPPAVFNLPTYKTLNVHFSLLPQYRGAAPMQWSLIKREPKTGVTLFWIDEGMDTGPVFLKKEIVVPPTTDAFELKNLLVSVGVEGLKEGLELIHQGKIERKPQEGTPTFAPPIKKELGQVDWARPAVEIDALVRGLAEWPGVTTRFASGPLSGQTLKLLKTQVLEVQPLEGGSSRGRPGRGQSQELSRGRALW